MTTDAKEIIMLFNYYKKAIVEAEDAKLYDQTTVKDWMGNF